MRPGRCESYATTNEDVEDEDQVYAIYYTVIPIIYYTLATILVQMLQHVTTQQYLKNVYVDTVFLFTVTYQYTAVTTFNRGFSL
jgi:hypothetical protein